MRSAPVRHGRREGRRAYDTDGADATADLSASFGELNEDGMEAVRRPGSHLDALDETLDLSSSFSAMDQPFLEPVRRPNNPPAAPSPAGANTPGGARSRGSDPVEDIEEYVDDFLDESISSSSMQARAPPTGVALD